MMVCGMRTVEIVRANVGDIRRKNGRNVLYVQGKGHVDTDDYIVLPDTVLDFAKLLELPKTECRRFAFVHFHVKQQLRGKDDNTLCFAYCQKRDEKCGHRRSEIDSA